MIRLVVVYDHDRIVGGVICIDDGPVLHVWLGGMAYDGIDFSPYTVCVAEAYRYALAQGKRRPRAGRLNTQDQAPPRPDAAAAARDRQPRPAGGHARAGCDLGPRASGFGPVTQRSRRLPGLSTYFLRKSEARGRPWHYCVRLWVRPAGGPPRGRDRKGEPPRYQERQGTYPVPVRTRACAFAGRDSTSSWVPQLVVELKAVAGSCRFTWRSSSAISRRVLPARLADQLQRDRSLPTPRTTARRWAASACGGSTTSWRTRCCTWTARSAS